MWMMSAMLLTVANKMIATEFGHLYTILLIQCSAAAVILAIATIVAPSLGRVGDLSGPVLFRMIPLVFGFVLNLLTSLAAMQCVSVATMVVIRNLTTLVVAAGEYFFLDAQLTPSDCACLAMMLAGGAYFAFYDLSFHVEGYVWLVANVTSSGFYQVYLKSLSKTSQSQNISSVVMALYNNLLALPLFFMMSLWRESNVLAAMAELKWFGISTLAVSCVLGAILSVTGFVVNGAITATSQMVINNVSKITLIVFSAAWEHQMRARTLLASAVVVGSASLFASFRGTTSSEVGMKVSPARWLIVATFAVVFVQMAWYDEVAFKGIEAYFVEPTRMLITPAARHSSVRCLGPYSDEAQQSRQEHVDASQPFTHYNDPPWWRRTCLLKAACLKPQSAPANPGTDLEAHVYVESSSLGHWARGLPSDVRSGFPLAKLQSQKQFNENQGAHDRIVLNIHDGVLPANATWHAGRFVVFRPFMLDPNPGAQNLGHSLFDDLFAIYFAETLFGPADPDLIILTVIDHRANPFLNAWAKGISSATVYLGEYPSDHVHCFGELFAGISIGAAMGLHLDNVGRTLSFQSFRSMFVDNFGFKTLDNATVKANRAIQILIIEKKKGSRRRIVNFQELRDAIMAEQLTMAVDLLDNIPSMSPHEQIRTILKADIIVTPMGGISFVAFFARVGTPVIVISHVHWEDYFWSNVGHLDVMCYRAQDDEVPNHAQLAGTDFLFNVEISLNISRALQFVRRAIANLP